MVRHVALFRWKPETTAEEVSRLEVSLHALPSRIPSIRSYRFGRDLGVQEGNADFAIVADFTDEAGLLQYANHPDHQAILKGQIGPMMAHREAIQYLIDPGGEGAGPTEARADGGPSRAPGPKRPS